MSGSGESTPPTAAADGSNANDDRFPRIPSESAIHRKNGGATDPGVITKMNKPWERSQSALDLQNNRTVVTSSSVDYTDYTGTTALVTTLRPIGYSSDGF